MGDARGGRLCGTDRDTQQGTIDTVETTKIRVGACQLGMSVDSAEIDERELIDACETSKSWPRNLLLICGASRYLHASVVLTNICSNSMNEGDVRDLGLIQVSHGDREVQEEKENKAKC